MWIDVCKNILPFAHAPREPVRRELPHVLFIPAARMEALNHAHSQAFNKDRVGYAAFPVQRKVRLFCLNRVGELVREQHPGIGILDLSGDGGNTISIRERISVLIEVANCRDQTDMNRNIDIEQLTNVIQRLLRCRVNGPDAQPIYRTSRKSEHVD